MNSPRILTKRISALLILSCLPVAVEAATKIWDGGAGGTGTDLAVPANWDLDTLPAANDTLQWNGSVAGSLSLFLNSTAFNAGTTGYAIDVTAAQTGSLQIDNTATVSANSMRLQNISIAAGAGAFTLGNGTGTSIFTLGGTGNTTNTWTNNSANAATIMSDVIFGNGNAVANRLLTLTGSGNWNMNTVFGVTVAGGGGSFALTKSGAGTLTLSAANTYSGITNITGGKIVLANVGALGTSTQLNFNNVSGTTVEFATDAPVTNAISTNSGTGFNTTLILNRATAGAALTQNLGLATYGGGTLNVQAGANVTSGTPMLVYSAVGLTSGTANSTATFAPTTANITINSASITSTANAKNLGLGGTSSGNIIPGAITNGIANATLSLVKSNTSTWTLGGTSTYSGATTINGGTLAITGTGSINGTSGITINGSGAKLLYTSSTAGTAAITQTLGTIDGTGSLGAVTVANNALNVITNGNGSTAALTLSALAFSGAATLSPAVNGGAGVNVTGALTTTPLNGTVTLGGSGIWANGLNNLITYGSFGGSIADFTKGTFNGLTGRQSADTLQLNGNAIAINILGDNPVWSGENGGIWRQFAQSSPTSATPAWTLQTATTATDFWQADTAIFDDNATGTTTATIRGGNISATSLTFNNAAKDYTITTDDGSGIAAGVLTKNGAAKVTIQSANTYSGGTLLNAGTLILDNASAIGTGAVTITGGALDSTTSTTLSTNNAQAWNGDFAFVGSTSLDMGTGNVTLGGAGTRAVTVNAGTLTVGEMRSTTQGFTKQGNGTLVLTSTGVTLDNDGSRIGGVLNVAAGTLQYNRTGAVTTGDLTVAGVTGSGSIVNGGSDERWLITNSAADHNFAGTLANGGTGKLGFNKQGAGTQTLSGSLSYTGVTTLAGGTLAINAPNSGAGTNVTLAGGATLVFGNTQPLGLASLISLTPAGTATVRYATDGGDTAYSYTMNSGSTLNVILDRATIGADVTHNLNTATGGTGLGSGTLNFTKTANVTGTATANFDRLNLGGGGGGTTLVAPAVGTVVTIGSVSKSANASAQVIGLDGVTTGNSVTGAITNGVGASIGVTKSNISTWTLSGTNTHTGATTVTGGTLILANANAAQASTVTLDIDNGLVFGSSIGTFNFGGLAGAGALNLTDAGTNAVALNIGGNAANYSGVLSGGGTLTKAGANTQTLSGTVANTHTGLTTVSAGVLALNKTAGINAVGGDVAISGTGQLSLLAGEQVPNTATITMTGTSTDALLTSAAVETVNNLVLNSTAPGVGGGQIIMRNNFVVNGTATVGSGILGVASGHSATVNAVNITATDATSAILRVSGNTVASTLNIGAGGITASGGDIQVKFNANNFDATLNLGGNVTTTGDVLFSNGNYAGASANVINLTGDRTFNIGAGTTTTVAPDIAGPGGLIKAGAGTLVLNPSVAATYAGVTTVNAGNLVVNGTISGSAVVNSGTIGGVGTITGALAIGDNAGIQDAIFDSVPGGIGIFNASNSVSFNTDALFTLEIHSDTVATDLLNAAGSVSLGSGVTTLNVFDLGSAVVSNGQVFPFVMSATGVSGTFAGLPDGAFIDAGSNRFEINYTPTSVELVAVPEPASAVLLLGGTALLGMRRSRRKS